MASVVVLVHGASPALAQSLPGVPPPLDIELVGRGEVRANASRYIGAPVGVRVFTHGDKRFAVVSSNTQGPHLVDISDPLNIDPLNVPSRSVAGEERRKNNFSVSGGLSATAPFEGADGRIYFIGTWQEDNAIQAFKIRQNSADTAELLAYNEHAHPTQLGRIMLAGGNNNFLQDETKLGGASDVIVYSIGAKRYAAVTAFTPNTLAIVDVTDPNNLGSSVTGSIADTTSTGLKNPTSIAYYQKGAKHYAVVAAQGDDGAVQIVDVSDPASPTAAGVLFDTAGLLLGDPRDLDLYSVRDRTYAAVVSSTEAGLQIVDVTDPANIFSAGKLGDNGSLLLGGAQTVSVIAIEDRHYAAVASQGERGVQLIDVTDPFEPVAAASIRDGQAGAEALYGANTLDAFSHDGRHFILVGSADLDGQIATLEDRGLQMIEILVEENTGLLDSSFGHGGIATAAFGASESEIFDVVEQSDGKFVAVGFVNSVNSCNNSLTSTKDFALARYNRDGSLDPGFGVGGRVLTNFTVPGSHCGLDDEARAVALQSDGKIVVAGYAATPSNGKEFVVARYSEDGTLDATFGPAIAGSKRGFAIHNFASGSQDDVANAVAVQTVGDNEHILVAGQSGTSFGLVRYNSTGGLDTGFGTIVNQSTRTGSQTIAFSTLEDGATSLAVDSSNKIVVAGFATNNNGTTTGTNPTSDDHKDFALARISTAGDLDSTFDTDGKQTSDLLLGGSDQVNAVAVQSDGKIVAAGFSGTSGDAWALARYTTAGVLDDGFGTLKGGMQPGREGNLVPNRAAGDPAAQLTDVAVQSDGKIIAAGYTTHATDPDDALLLRVSSVGVVESAFGEAFTGDFYPASPAVGSDRAGRNARIQALALLGGGGVVLGGFVNTGSVSEFAVIAVSGTGELADDSGFGVGGVVTTSFGSAATAQAMAVQSDGKIVVAGYVNNDNDTLTDTSDDHNDFAVARFNPDGTLDTSFGTRGWVTTDVGAGTNDSASAVAIDSSGNILVAGGTNDGSSYDSNDFAVVRYTSAGVLDATFSTDGKLTTDFNSRGDVAFAVAVDSAGRIIVGGGAGGADGIDDLGLVRYTTAGALDATFDTDGKATTDVAGGTASIQGLAIAGDDKVVAVGKAHSGVSDDFVVARYTTTGALDNTFGDAASGATKKGFVATAVATGGADGAQAVTLDADGRIVVAGWTTNDAGTPGGGTDADDDYTEFALARYTSAGVLDTSFNSGGTVTLGFGTSGNDSAGRAVDVDAKGRIIVGGDVAFGTSERAFALARFNADGTLDTDFGTDGKVTTDFGTTTDVVYGVAAQPTSGGPRILAAGRSGGEFRLARYRAAPPQSTDASLSALTVSTSSDGSIFAGTGALSPVFDSATSAYTTALRSTVSHYQVTPTVADKAATVTVNGTTLAGGTTSAAVAVTPGETSTVTVEVTAEDGFNTEAYTIAVTALSGDATLSALSLASSTDPSATTFTGTGVLEPAFDAAVTGYASTLLPDVVAVRVTPTAADAGATITVQGNTLASGAESQPISVTLGTTATVTVVVTAQDDQITNTYTVAVTAGNAATVAVGPNPLGEGSTAQVTVSITETQTSAINIPLTVTAGTAEEGDYDIPASVRIAPGFSSGSVLLSALHDRGDDDETLTITLGSPLPADLQPGTPRSVEVTIEDDEFESEVSISRVGPGGVVAPTIVEGDEVFVVLSLNPPRPEAVSVPVTLQPGSAETSDFSTIGSIMIDALQTEGVGTFRTNQDSDNDDETLTVTLGAALPHLVAAGATTTTTITIEDDEGAVTPRNAPVVIETQAGNASLTAVWSYRNQDAAAAAPTGFDVEYRATGGATAWSNVTASAVFSGPPGRYAHTITSLTNGTTYEVRARARNDAGTGPWSHALGEGTPAAPPAAPANVSAVAGSSHDRITVSWDSVASATAYQIRFRASGETNWQNYTLTGDTAAQRFLSSPRNVLRLAAETTYEVQVRALISNSTGPWSTTASATTTATPPPGSTVDPGTPSGPPTGGTATPSGPPPGGSGPPDDTGSNTDRDDDTSDGDTTGDDSSSGDGDTTGGDGDASTGDSAAQLARTAASRFADVDTGDFYAAPVGWLLLHNITSGCTTNRFCPNSPTSRQDFVTFLWRAAGEPAPTQPGSATFTDITAGHYADTAIGWALQQNITTGCGTNNNNQRLFCPNDQVTRAQIAAFLYRYTGATTEPNNTFTDVHPQSYYAAAVTWMNTHKITTGCDTNTNNPKFCPNQPATRAQVATFLHRITTTPTSWGTNGGILKPNRTTST